MLASCPFTILSMSSVSIWFSIELSLGAELEAVHLTLGVVLAKNESVRVPLEHSRERN